jgi:hypothetical protein
MQTLEQFERDIAAKRERLLRDLAIVERLPTTGRTFTWTGDGGYESDGMTKKPPAEKSLQLVPWIIHAPFRGCEHVAYRVPLDAERTYGEYHRRMSEGYLRAVCDSFVAKSVIDILALKGTYHSYVPETFDWAASRDYKDAEEVNRGQCVVRVNTGVGAHGFTSTRLEFYVHIEGIGPCEIALEMPTAHLLVPRPVVERYSHGAPSTVARWDLPPSAGLSLHQWRRGSGEHRKLSFGVEYLFETVDSALDACLPAQAAVTA